MTIQKKPRLANMELLRFMAMFMILTLHADLPASDGLSSGIF